MVFIIRKDLEKLNLKPRTEKKALGIKGKMLFKMVDYFKVMPKNNDGKTYQKGEKQDKKKHLH